MLRNFRRSEAVSQYRDEHSVTCGRRSGLTLDLPFAIVARVVDLRSFRPSMSPTCKKSAANWGLRSIGLVSSTMTSVGLVVVIERFLMRWVRWTPSGSRASCGPLASWAGPFKAVGRCRPRRHGRGLELPARTTAVKKGFEAAA